MAVSGVAVSGVAVSGVAEAMAAKYSGRLTSSGAADSGVALSGVAVSGVADSGVAGALTVTRQLACRPPASTDTSAVPSPTAVSVPSCAAVTTRSLLLCQAGAGASPPPCRTAAASTVRSPGARATAARERLTLCTASPTCTAHIAVRELPGTLATMAVSPVATPRTTPDGSTVATRSLADW